jgi:hypothetical protein
MITKFNRVFIRSYRKSSKFNLELTNDLKEIIIGLLLGDLHAEKRNLNCNTRLQFKQSNKNKDYIEHLFTLFKSYCGSPPKPTTWFDNRINRNKLYSSVKFWTLSLPCFNIFKELFYTSTGVKILPVNLSELLTAKGLAYWLMDDGYNSVNGFYFCTESYTLIENEKLVKILKEKFDLDCGVHKHTNGYRLYVFSSSKNKLLELVKPYLLKHFYYKFDL